MAKKLQLVPDWKQSWRFLSVQLAGLLAVVQAAYEYLPAIQQYLPEGWVKWFAIAIIVARVVRQQSLEPPVEESEESPPPQA